MSNSNYIQKTSHKATNNNNNNNNNINAVDASTMFVCTDLDCRLSTSSNKCFLHCNKVSNSKWNPSKSEPKTSAEMCKKKNEKSRLPKKLDITHVERSELLKYFLKLRRKRIIFSSI